MQILHYLVEANKEFNIVFLNRKLTLLHLFPRGIRVDVTMQYNHVRYRTSSVDAHIDGLFRTELLPMLLKINGRTVL